MARPSKSAPDAYRRKPRTRYHSDKLRLKLGARVKRVRTSKGYSIDRLSLEMDHLSRATISRIERGLTDPQVSTLARIAECLDVTLSFLVDFSRDR